MNKTAINRNGVSAPMKYLAQRRGAPYGPMEVLHFGEGKAYEDTKYLTRNGANVTPYDPYSDDVYTRDSSRLNHYYDLGISFYVFNTLRPLVRAQAFEQLMNCCDHVIVAVRTDKVKGIPLADGVLTKRRTFQTQLNAIDWHRWFLNYTDKQVDILHNGGHYAMFEME